MHKWTPCPSLRVIAFLNIKQTSTHAGTLEWCCCQDGRFLRNWTHLQSLLNAVSHLCCRLQPMPVPAPTQLAASMEGLRTDDELAQFISRSKGGGTAVVEFGTTWCVKCHEMFPQFFALSRKVCAGSCVAL
jgi:thiol-disulfide isomerase/thioredoxin